MNGRIEINGIEISGAIPIPISKIVTAQFTHESTGEETLSLAVSCEHDIKTPKEMIVVDFKEIERMVKAVRGEK